MISPSFSHLEHVGGTMQFEFAMATQIRFGESVRKDIASLVRSYGRKVLVVTGRTTARSVPLMKELTQNDMNCLTFRTTQEPSIHMVNEAVEEARDHQCDVVIGFGGGSAIDAGKAIAMLLSNDGYLNDYFVIEGGSRSIQKPSAPFFAIPTTPGTGAEVSKDAVFVSDEQGVKCTLRDPSLFPTITFVDPELTYTLPPCATAWTGMCALSQLIESYVSSYANPMVDTICREGILRIANSLKSAYVHSHDALARYDLSLASLLSGLSKTNTKPGVICCIAYVIGAYIDIPYALICAKLLSQTIKANVNALLGCDPSSTLLVRYDDVAQILTGDVNATRFDGVEWLRELSQTFSLPSFSKYGLKPEDVEPIVETVQSFRCIQSIPIALGNSELTRVIHSLFKH